MGSANAAAIVLGNMIGEGKREEAERCARTLMIAVPAASLFISLLIFLMAPVVPSFFNISEEVSRLIVQFLRILSIVVFIKTSNMHLVIGLLRGGGDTHICMAIELVPLWFITIPLVALCGLVFHLPPPIVYSVAMTEEVIKYAVGIRRVLSGKWIHNLTG
jgi:Na+-driven multidrug efflux pump